MRRTFILASVMAAAAFVATAPASAQQWKWNERGWRTIGYKTVDGRDTDTIYLPGRSTQREVRVCSLNAPLHLRDFDVRFANGGHQNINTRAMLPAGRCTRAVDLKGNRRDVVSVRLRYEPVARMAHRPLVRVQVR